MVAKNTILNIKKFLRPALDTGLIDPVQFEEVLKAIKNTNNNKEEEERIITRQELMKRWSCSKTYIYKYEKNGKLKPLGLEGIKRYRLSQILNIEEN